MKDVAGWRPTKFVRTDRGLRASDDPAAVSPGSRFVTDLLAGAYDAALREHARGRLLDVGCGEVPLYESYRALVDEAICIDWAQTAQRQRHIDLACDLNQAIPLPDASFDTVLATDVLEHIARPELLFSELARLLRPGGKLILGVPFLYGIHEEPHDYHRYTEYRLRDLCRANRLAVLSLEPYGGSPEVLADLTAKHVARWPLVSRLHLGISRAAAATALWRRVSRRTARRFPLGYCVVAQAGGR